MSLFLVILGCFFITIILMMMFYPGFTKNPFAPMCSVMCPTPKKIPVTTTKKKIPVTTKKK